MEQQQQQNKSARTSASTSPRKENDGRADPSPARVRKEPRARTPPPSREPLSPTLPNEGEGAGEAVGESAGEKAAAWMAAIHATVAEVLKLEKAAPGRSYYTLQNDALVEGLEGKRVSIDSLEEEGGVWMATYTVEPKRTPAAEPLPARFFLPTGAKKRKPRARKSGGGGSYPIERPMDEAQLQPLAEAAASEDGLEGAVAARDALAAGVSTKLAAQVNLLQVGLALELSKHHIPLAEYEAHWGTACMLKMLVRAEFLYRVSGRTMHLSPPTRELPEGLGERDNETRCFFFHFPPPRSARFGYTSPAGHATDPSTVHVEMAAQSAVPEGVQYPFICQLDLWTDLAEFATDYKGADGKDFSYQKHYLDSLSDDEKMENTTTKVELLAAMMVAERKRRGRLGMVAYVAGELPDKHAPTLLKKAAAMATEELQREDASAAAYMVRRPTNLPAAERATSKKGEKGQAGTESRVDHTCQADQNMPSDQRQRNDATVTQVQGGILLVPVRYFEALGEKSKDGVGARLRGDTLSLCAPEPYTGSFPPKDEAEAAARQAAIKLYMEMIQLGGAEAWAAIPAAERAAALSNAASLSARGGAELVAKAAAGDKAAEAESRRKASAGLVRDGSHNKGKRGGVRARVSEEGEVRKTKRMKALTPEATEEAACAHFSKLGLSTENPLARCSGCSCWNLLFPVFADDLSRAPGPGRKHNKTGNESCGRYEALVAA